MGPRRYLTIRRFILMVLVSILTLSCTIFGKPPALQPATPVASGPKEDTRPTAVSPVAVTPVPAKEIASSAGKTESKGEVRFSDPLTDQQVRVTVVDEQQKSPLAGIQVTFASNGAKVLLIATDPDQKYAPVVKEISYSELGSQSRRPGSGAKLAAPAQVIPLVVVLGMVTFLSIWETGKSVLAFFNDYPELENWSESQVTYCLRPDQISNAKEVVLNSVFLLAGGPLGKVFGKIAASRALVIDEKSIEGLAELMSSFLQEQFGEKLDTTIQKQKPYIVRWKEYRIKGAFTYFARPDGYCLDPLDASSPQVIMNWVNYGIEHNDPYALVNLPMFDEIGFANYLEGGQTKSKSEYQYELAQRLKTSYPICDGYNFEDNYFKVWTHNWEPDWQMTELCYVDCNPINPPYQSDIHAFFFVQDSGEWKLRTIWVNDWELFSFGKPYPLSSCSQPVQIPADLSQHDPQPQQNSCPGAPPQRMEVGKYGKVCTQKDSVAFRKNPAKSGDVIDRFDPGFGFKVIGGPSCADDWSWWQVELSGGQRGWISEGGDSTDPYFICPIP